MFERDLPGENKAGFSGQSVSALPLETCETINGAWGFNITDRAYKSDKELIHLLVKAAGYGANLLLNIGPMPNGEIQPEFIERLNSIGRWIEKNGATIYGTHGGFIRPQEWGCVTQKDQKVFIHLFQKPAMPFELDIPGKVKSIKIFGTDAQTVPFKQKNQKTTFDLEAVSFNDIDTILEVTLK